MTEQILTRETEKKVFSQSFLSAFLLGENITAVWAPGGGRRKAMVYLARNASSLGFNQLGRYQIFYIDHNDLIGEEPKDYYLLLLKNLHPNNSLVNSQDQETTFSLLKERVQGLVKKGYHLILILGQFDVLEFPGFFFNNLRLLHQIDKTKVHFVFATDRDIFQPESLKKYDDLAEILCQNIIYFPIYSRKDALFIAHYLNQKYHYQLSTHDQEIVVDLCGGHPLLIRTCLGILRKEPEIDRNKLAEKISQKLEIRLILENIWRALDEKEKIFINLVGHGITSQKEKPSGYLLGTGLVSLGQDQKFQLFSPLFLAFIKTQKNNLPRLNLDPDNQEILINGQPLQEGLSLQEHHLLNAFLKKPQTIISRDEISTVLWGKKSDEKYSEWAIDQAISQLRKKLTKMNISPQNLQTIRGRGYRWIG